MEKFAEQFKLNSNNKLRNDDLEWYKDYNTFFYFISEYFHYHKPLIIPIFDPLRRKNKEYPSMLLRLQNLLNISQFPILQDQIVINREIFTQFFIEFREKTEFYRSSLFRVEIMNFVLQTLHTPISSP